MSGGPDRVVLRSARGVGLVLAIVIIELFLLGDAVVRGAGLLALLATPWLALIAWFAYLLLGRPCVVLTATGIELVNVLRVHFAPWQEVDGIRSRFQVRVDLTDGRMLRSWGAPTSSVDRPTVADLRPSTSARHRVVPAHVIIERFRAAHERVDPRATTTTRWDLPAIVGSLVIAAACAGSALTTTL